MPQLQSNHQYSHDNCSNHPSRVILLGLLMSAIGSTQAATPIKPNKPPSSKLITDVTTYVERDWRSDDGQFFLTLYSGIWKPHGTLFFLKKRGGLSVDGFQKGLNITLSSFDPEIGLEAPPEYAVTGALNLRSNTLIGSITQKAQLPSGRRRSLRQFLLRKKHTHNILLNTMVLKTQIGIALPLLESILSIKIPRLLCRH
ncbi:hypothetical protein [Psychrobacter sp. SWN149]|uniref:hypothetical protein n=1 Tax=Psychrobacter sp. SWN149 TaxID=2792057 RepID=UPI0018CD380C|nr:hypothetical protein [Psychrobacter sp. SWN149]MBH0005808.1 hypothetical protein [Psychrobacter sp. SWN149]